MSTAPSPVSWSLIRAAAQSAAGASSLLWIGNVLSADLPIRPMTCATVYCRSDDGFQATTIVMLDSLNPFAPVLRQSIPVSIQQEDGVFVASFSDANINASGETLSDALDMLKEMIVFTYEEFSEDESALGVSAQNQLAILKRFVRT